MKNFTRNAVLSLGLAVLGPISVMAQSLATFNIPFDFTAGSKSFPAGRYLVRQTPSTLMLSSTNSRLAVVLVPHMSPADEGQTKSTATFEKHGDLYILSEVTNAGYRSDIPKSRLAKEQIARQPSRNTTIEVSSARQ
jgi:hypothetical protein